MNKIILVSPNRLITDPARNPRFAKANDPATAAKVFYATPAYEALCASFKASGITIPLCVAKCDRGYMVLEGFSRAHWAKREAKKNPSLKVPVTVVRKAKDARTASIAMNTARVAYDPIARAGSFATLVEEWGSVPQAAKRAGVSPANVREAMRLLSLPIKAQRMIQSGKLSVQNAMRITRLPGWKAFQAYKSEKDTSAKTRRESDQFLKRVGTMLETMRTMKNVPDVGSVWNEGRGSKAVNTDDVAVVLPTVEAIREACLRYGRKIARLYMKQGADPDNAAAVLRYRTGILHLGAAMGWCVPKALEKTLVSTNGKPLYKTRIARALCREVVNEYVLAGVVAVAHGEGRGFGENDELLDDENWQRFFRQNAPLETLVQRLNRRLR